MSEMVSKEKDSSCQLIIAVRCNGGFLPSGIVCALPMMVFCISLAVGYEHKARKNDKLLHLFIMIQICVATLPKIILARFLVLMAGSTSVHKCS